jgi:hypothetical protein
MNIKGFIQSAINISSTNAVDKIQKTERAIKSDQAQERDANGQEFYSKQNKKQQKMTDEQFKKAVEILLKKQFMVEMQWHTSEILENEIKYIEIKNSENEVIRRLSEFDLWELFEDVSTENHKGQLLKKSA